MRRIFIFLLTLNQAVIFGQSFPVKCTFVKMYLGEYDLTEHRTTSLRLSEVYAVDVDFDGVSSFTAIYQSMRSSDTLRLKIVQESQTRGDDFAEYKFTSPDGFVIFLRYNLYGVPGIRELSIFHPDKTKFFYIKRIANVNVPPKRP